MANEVDTNSAPLMDRGLPLGNSEDVFLRRALHVKIGNKPSEAIPVTLYEVSGDELIFVGENNTSAEGETTLISETVPDGKTWFLSAINVGCTVDARFNLYLDGTLTLRLRTGPSETSKPYIFSPKQPILEGVTVEVKVISAAYVPESDSDVTLQIVETAI